MDIKRKLQQVPSSPGIYVMKGAKERVLYVGKAKNLRNRLRSYFQFSASLDDRKAKMVRDVQDFEYIVANNELEALVLEANFIKRVKPRYNIILRDDKNYPYLKLTVNEEWPRLEVVRKVEKDGALYFGPYVPSGGMREMLKFIRRHFPIRVCRYNLDRPFRPCVQYQMGRCLAPCSPSLRGPLDRDRYMKVVDDVRAFIKGERKSLLENLENRMKKLSEEMRYEEAAAVRDRLRAVEQAWESQRAIAPELGDMDVIGFYREQDEASVYVLFIRNGMVIGRKEFFLKETGAMENTEMIAGFIEQFYLKEMPLPRRIVVPVDGDFQTQKKWLSRKKGSTVRISGAGTGPEKEVLKMADDNAFYAFSRHKNRGVDQTLLKIRDLLHLDVVPGRIGAVDVSNISGSEAVGALIIYDDGNFVKDDYRLFRIKSVEGINDFAMIEEVVRRYMNKAADGREKLPQLLLIDGGRGQLEAALQALQGLDVRVSVAGIAKAKSRTQKKTGGVRSDMERVYLPGKKSPVYLEPFDAATHLLQKIRDEVHRVAIGYHKKLRAKRTLESPLENIGGIGKTRRLLLLKHFGSVEAIRQAPLEEIAALKGMNRKVAENIKKELR